MTAATSAFTKHKSNSNQNVSFGEISIREYIMNLGDNPSVSIGPPVGLSWEYKESGTHTVDDFEKERQGKRRKVGSHKLKLNYYQRMEIIQATGVEEADIKDAERQVFWDQSCRTFSKYLCYPHVFAGDVRAQTGRWRNKMLLNKLQKESNANENSS
ncbi:expressed unknown protein [Seminavis robusta]|uniref:Uncharacterized protein n=1 Tax=Seminavis robusta TaxID=568900 RepID=A0A9N8DJQ0_9STRA|nr:expressed unknown protein [Seminavis robusta]|eukprot:Sro118_g057920.1 n/a (157) ;mRNA; r:109024-109494